MAKRNPSAAAVPAAALARPGKTLGQRIVDNRQLYLLLLVPVILTFVYKYIPMYGIQIAFRDFKASRGYTGSEWVGWYWFQRFFSAPTFGRMIKNTVLISLYSLLWSFPVPIILSLMINQLRSAKYKRVVQTVLYAPQTLLSPDGRRVMIAWMQNWDTAGAKPCHCRWFGQMTLPRELSVKDGRLYQNPVQELEDYRSCCVTHRNIPVCGEVNLPGVQGRVLDMTVNVRPTGGEMYRWFRIRVAKDAEHETIIRYRPGNDTVKIDRTRSGLPHDIVHTRSFLVRPQNGEIKLRIILDRFSVEVFVNDGAQAASTVIYTRQEADAITFEAGGSVLMDVKKYDLFFDKPKTET